MRPLPEKILSIAIPTKNRQVYLKQLVEELQTSARQDFEIIIQDNSDDDSLGAWIETKGDPRIVYHYQPGWISVVDNCDEAIARCSGHYVCMLGDDDGIMLDEAIEELADALNSDVEAVMGPVLNYVWPDLEHPLIDRYGGRLYTTPIKGMSMSEDLGALAKRVVRCGGAMGLQDLPCVYHGFVSRDALERLRDLAGSCFPGPSPDMANAIGLSAVLRNLRRTPKILAITGHSIKSTAGAGTQRKHHGPIEDQRHLPSDTVATWHPAIPRFWSGPTIYAQSVYRALSRTKNRNFGEPRLACVYAACWLFHGEYRSHLTSAVRNHGGAKTLLGIAVLFHCVAISMKRAKNLLLKLGARWGPRKVDAVRALSISHAIQAVREQQHLRLNA